MLRLSLTHVKPGMISSRDIYNANGSLLLGKDLILDANLIERLTNMDVDSLYVKNLFFETELAEDVLYEKTRLEAVQLVQETFEEFQKSQILRLYDIRQVIERIIEDILMNRDVLIHLTDIRARGDYTFVHSVNVCLISAMIGVKMHLADRQLTELATGAILHDVGMMSVSPELVNKKDRLTSQEWDITKMHTDLGFDILRMQGTVTLAAAYVAYQHHENFDGTGYPRGISGEEIHQYARIAAVADIYDAMTSDRAHRPAGRPRDAYEVICGSRGTMLDPQIVDIFLENVAIFPEGTMVLLDTGEIGVVVKVIPKLQSRPIVKVVGNESGTKITGGRIVDLTQEMTRFVIKAYLPEEVVSMKLNA